MEIVVEKTSDPTADLLAGYSTNELETMRKQVSELFEEGTFQGDIARCDIEDVTERDVFIMEAIIETALKCGHRFE